MKVNNLSTKAVVWSSFLYLSSTTATATATFTSTTTLLMPTITTFILTLTLNTITNPTSTSTNAQSQSQTQTQPPPHSAGKLRSMAEEAISKHDYQTAVTHYQTAINLEPNNALNHYKLYRVHSRMKLYSKALQDISSAVTLDNGKERVDYHLAKCKLLVSLGQCDEAVQAYSTLSSSTLDIPDKDASTISSGQTEATNCANELHTATLAYHEQRFDTAVHFYELALGHMEHNSDILFLKAQSEFGMGDYYGVISDTAKILKVQTKHLEAYQLRGQAYYKLGEFDTATSHYREALLLDPEHKGCKAGHKLIKSILKKEKRGNEAMDRNEYKEAIDHWWAAIHLDTTLNSFHRTTLLKIVKAHSKAGQHEDAILQVKRYMEEREDMDGFFALGEVYTAAEMWQEAVNLYRKAMEFEPNDREPQTKQKLREAEVALKQSKEKNYYKILGLQRNASKKEIKKAYRDLALEWHPDKNADNKDEAEKKFQDISEAYEVLSDEELKGKYDRGEEVFENQGGGGGRPHGNAEHIFRHFHQGSGGGGGRQHHFRFN